MIRHFLPDFGALPSDPEGDAMSGLVGAAWQIARCQARRGNEVELWGMPRHKTQRPARFDSVQLHPIRTIPWLRTSRYDLRYLAPVALRASMSKTPDVVHVHSNPYLLLALRGRVRVLHVHMAAHLAPRLARIVGRADAVVCASHFLRDQFLTQTAFPASRCHVVYNGIDPTRFGDEAAARGRALYPRSEGEFRILFAGQVSWEKGLHEALRALRMVLERDSDARTASSHRFRLVIAGSSSLWWNGESSTRAHLTPYEAQARELARGLDVSFIGAVPHRDVPALMSSADVFILPSLVQEGFPVAAMEAQAAGTPVIASAVGGLPECVSDGETGILVQAGGTEQIAAAIETLAAHHEVRDAMAGRARRRAMGFTWDRAAREIEAIYDDARTRRRLYFRRAGVST